MLIKSFRLLYYSTSVIIRLGVYDSIYHGIFVPSDHDISVIRDFGRDTFLAPRFNTNDVFVIAYSSVNFIINPVTISCIHAS